MNLNYKNNWLDKMRLVKLIKLPERKIDETRYNEVMMNGDLAYELLKILPYTLDTLLFPNLTTLVITMNWINRDEAVSAIVVMVSPSLKHLRVIIDVNVDSTSQIYDLYTFLNGLHSKSVELQILEFVSSNTGDEFVPQSIDYLVEEFHKARAQLKSMRRLRTIKYPADILTLPMLSLFSSLSQLEELDIGSDCQQGLHPEQFDWKSQGKKRFPKINQLFPKLSKLALCGEWHHMKFILNVAFPDTHQLQDLSINIRKYASEYSRLRDTSNDASDPDVGSKLLQSLSSRFPSLKN